MNRRSVAGEMLCDDVRDVICSMLESDQDSTEQEAVARHLKTCPECASFAASMTKLDTHLKAHPHQGIDTDQLWLTIRSRIAAERAKAGGTGLGLGRPVTRRAVAGWAAAFVAAAAAPYGIERLVARDQGDQTFLAEIVEDFETFERDNGTLDISGGDADGTRDWVARRIGFELPLSLIGPRNASLSGGRVCSISGRKIAFFFYSIGASGFGLYVAPSIRSVPPGSDRFTTTFRDDGAKTAVWQRNGLAFFVVSRSDPNALLSFVSHFRRSPTVEES